MTCWEGETVETKIVSANDIAMALANELSYNTGLLPENTLWWRNTRGGPVYAIYDPPNIRVLALQEDINKPAKRFKLPLPGFIFLASPGKAPWVYAVKKRPTKETDLVYHAPLLNIYANGRSCPGSNKYPVRVNETIESFWLSFFSDAADRQNRSIQFPKNIIGLWQLLNSKKEFPVDDMIQLGTVHDLMTMGMNL